MFTAFIEMQLQPCFMNELYARQKTSQWYGLQLTMQVYCSCSKALIMLIVTWRFGSRFARPPVMQTCLQVSLQIYAERALMELTVYSTTQSFVLKGSAATVIFNQYKVSYQWMKQKDHKGETLNMNIDLKSAYKISNALQINKHKPDNLSLH